MFTRYHIGMNFGKWSLIALFGKQKANFKVYRGDGFIVGPFERYSYCEHNLFLIHLHFPIEEFCKPIWDSNLCFNVVELEVT